MKRFFLALALLPNIAFADRSFYSANGIVSSNIYGVGQSLTVGDSVTVDLSAAGDGQVFARRDASNAKMRVQALGTSKTGFFACDRARGTSSSPTALGSDESMCSWVSQGYDGSTWAHSAEILTNTTEAWSGSAHGAGFNFLAVLDGTTAQYSPMRLNYTGDGSIYLFGGNVSTGHINLYPLHSSAQVKVVNAAGNTTWAFSNSGTFTSSNIADDIGWRPVAAANQACNTTCTSGAVYGINIDAGFVAAAFVAPSTTTADVCICSGAS